MNVPMPPPAAPGPAGSGEPRSGVPPWALPAGLGAVAALVLVLVVFVLTRGGDDETVAPATSVAADVTAAVTTVATTATDPSSTATTASTPAPATSAAATTVAETTAPTVPGPLGPGTAAITSDGVTSRYTIAVTCTDFWAGIETTSHVLIDDASGAVWVANLYASEEGGQRGIEAVDMASAIASVLYGLDTPGTSPTYVGGLDDSLPGITRTTASLTSGDGPSTIDIEIGEPATADDCSTGSWEAPSPFTLDEQIVWQPSDDTVGQRFNVLAECGGELLLTGGALLVSSYPEDGNTMIALLANTFVLTGEDVVLSNYVIPEPNETAYALAAGGDVRAAMQLFRDGNRSSEPIYLEWTERPLRSAIGERGLLDEVCPSP